MIADAQTEDDAALLERITRHDPEGIALLYDRYHALALVRAYRLMHDRGAAEDIVQEAFFKVWRRADTYDGTRGTVRAWLMTIVFHESVNTLRARRVRGGVVANGTALYQCVRDEEVTATVEAAMEGEHVRNAIAMLPTEQRQVIALAYFEELTQTEIAHRIAIPLGTVKGRTRLAFKKLRDTLQAWEGVTVTLRTVTTATTVSELGGAT